MAQEDLTSKAKSLLNKVLKGRPQPSAPRAGYKASGSRYEKGGRVTRKKSVSIVADSAESDL